MSIAFRSLGEQFSGWNTLTQKPVLLVICSLLKLFCLQATLLPLIPRKNYSVWKMFYVDGLRRCSKFTNECRTY